MSALLLHCRPGFEPECAAEAERLLPSLHGVPAVPGSALVVLEDSSGATPAALAGAVPFARLVFARDVIATRSESAPLSVGDRITPILESVRRLEVRAGSLRLETPDTTEARQLLALCRALERPLASALRKAGLLEPAAVGLSRLHVVFTASTQAHVGLSLPDNASPWPMGIPRLRLPRGAPSRSTLKLDEALQVFLSPAARAQALQPGMRAVDLGASPGGWTWQLVTRGLKVTAVDNGAIDARLLATGQVDHLRVDGFRYLPRQPVDWLVCDMIEQPARIAALVARWVEARLFRHAVFNLKLPMKRRLDEVDRCRATIEAALAATRADYRMAFRQLYHDREEVTGFVSLAALPAPSSAPSRRPARPRTSK